MSEWVSFHPDKSDSSVMWLCSRSLLYCTSFRENLDRFQSLNVYKLISSAHSPNDISKQKLQWYFQDVVDILSLARYRPSVKDRMEITSCVHHLLLKIISYRFYIFLRVVCSTIRLIPFRPFLHWWGILHLESQFWVVRVSVWKLRISNMLRECST